MSEALRARLRSKGPKRILSLDGGGIRGLITLGFLERIEAILAHRTALAGSGDPVTAARQFRLRDHYDLIGGTSTGAIIAAALAIGMSVSEIVEMYLDLGARIFANPAFLGRLSGGMLTPKFPEKPLRDILDEKLGNRTLGDPSITTGLCIVAKRADRNSVWPIVNAPDNIFYDFEGEPNSEFLLSQIVRASTAAPTYFAPENVHLGEASYRFIDGGISMHNNPALQLLMVATVPKFGFSWPVGPDDLSIVSIGTGDWSRRVEGADGVGGRLPVLGVGDIINMFMEDASRLNETILQATGIGRNRRYIDRTTECLDGALWGNPVMRYERFQAYLEADFFAEHGLGHFTASIPLYRQMDNITRMKDLLEIGRVLAERLIEPGDLP